MPAIASLEDLRAARKEGLSIYAMLYALCAMLFGWRRIGWKNVCGAPVEKGRAIQRLSGGDIPTKSRWPSAVGASCGWKREVRSN